MAIDL